MKLKKIKKMDGLIEFIHIQMYREKLKKIGKWFIYQEND
jgi:hypothetical protein